MCLCRNEMKESFTSLALLNKELYNNTNYHRFFCKSCSFEKTEKMVFYDVNNILGVESG